MKLISRFQLQLLAHIFKPPQPAGYMKNFLLHVVF